MAAYEGTNDEWRQAIWGRAAHRTRLKMIESNARSVLAKKKKKKYYKWCREDAVVQGHNKQFGFQPNNVLYITTGMLEIPECFLPADNV